MEQKANKPNSRAVVLIALHVLLLVYSLCGFFSKNASRQPFMSFEFCAFYAGMLAILVVYAIGWQQILKRLPLTVAFANKAITVVWGIIWGAVFFQEAITLPMIIGAIIVMAGIVLFSIADGEERQAAEAEERLVAESEERQVADGGEGPVANGEEAHVADGEVRQAAEVEERQDEPLGGGA